MYFVTNNGNSVMNNTTNGFWMLLLNRFYSHPRIPGTTSLFRCIQWQPYFGPNDICSAISETTKPIIVIAAEPLRTSFRFSSRKVASFFLPKYDVWSLQNPPFCKRRKYRVSHFQFGNFESLYFEEYLT